jgi:hypothetical protein
VEETLQLLRQKGIPEAFVVPYINGWPISKSQAQQLVKQYPDLNSYLTGSK